MDNVKVTGRNIEITESIIASVHNAFAKLDAKFPKMNASVVINDEKSGFKVVSTFTAEHGDVVNATSIKSTFQVAMKSSITKLTAQLMTIKTNHDKQRKQKKAAPDNENNTADIVDVVDVDDDVNG